MSTGNKTSFLPGTAVRFFSMVGPCLTATVIRRNRTTYTLNFCGSKHYEQHALVHDTPCHSCTDHPRSQYPNGYMD